MDWVSGPQLAVGTDKWSARVALALSSPLGAGGAKFRRRTDDEIEVDSGFTGVWRRDCLERYGGWDEGWPVNQDHELAARIRADGGRIVCIPEMAAEYIPRNSLGRLAKQYWRYGIYRAKTSRAHPESMRRSHVLAPGLALTAAAAASLAPRPIRRPAQARASAIYVLALLIASLREAGAGWLRGRRRAAARLRLHARAARVRVPLRLRQVGPAAGRAGCTPPLAVRFVVYTDQVYKWVGDELWTDRTFPLFVAEVGKSLDRLIVLGRVRADAGEPRFRMPDGVEFVELPHYGSLVERGAVLTRGARLVQGLLAQSRRLRWRLGVRSPSDRDRLRADDPAAPVGGSCSASARNSPPTLGGDIPAGRLVHLAADVLEGSGGCSGGSARSSSSGPSSAGSTRSRAGCTSSTFR